MYKEITIKRQSTDEQLINQRTIYYDVYENGEYSQTFEDINDAIEYKEEQERKDREYQKRLQEMVKGYEDKELERLKNNAQRQRIKELKKRDQKKEAGADEAANIADWLAYENERIVATIAAEQNRRILEKSYQRKQNTQERLLKSIETYRDRK